MYKNLAYIVYRTVIDYYAGPGDVDEDAFDMRKAMPRDVDKKSMVPLKHPVHCDEVE